MDCRFPRFSLREHRLVFQNVEMPKNKIDPLPQKDTMKSKEEEEMRLDIVIRRANEALANVKMKEEGLTDATNKLREAYNQAINALQKQIDAFGDAPITKNWQRDIAALQEKRDQLMKGAHQLEKQEPSWKELTQTAEALHNRLRANDGSVTPLQVFEAYSNAMAALNREMRSLGEKTRDLPPPSMANEYSRLNDQRREARNLLTENEEAELPRIVRKANDRFDREWR